VLKINKLQNWRGTKMGTSNLTPYKVIPMAYMNKYQSDDYRRDELIRIIGHSVEKLTLAELEALYYDMTTKSYIND
jgi:hypothetical protein